MEGAHQSFTSLPDQLPQLWHCTVVFSCPWINERNSVQVDDGEDAALSVRARAECHPRALQKDDILCVPQVKMKAIVRSITSGIISSRAVLVASGCAQARTIGEAQ